MRRWPQLLLVCSARCAIRLDESSADARGSQVWDITYRSGVYNPIR